MEEDKGEGEKEQKKEHELTLDSPIKDFLSKINLSQYAAQLEKEGYNSVRDLETFSKDKVELKDRPKNKILLEYVTNNFIQKFI